MDKLRISAIEGRAAIPDYYRSEPARTDITYLVGRVKELEFQISGNERARCAEVRQLQAIITALTQDRAAVLEEVKQAVMYLGIDRPEFTITGKQRMEIVTLIESMLAPLPPVTLAPQSTPPATQAEPKPYWRRHANGGTTLAPDTRNPAEADRRKSAGGGGIRIGYEARVYERDGDAACLPSFGRRGGDHDRWGIDISEDAINRLIGSRNPQCGPDYTQDDMIHIVVALRELRTRLTALQCDGIEKCKHDWQFFECADGPYDERCGKCELVRVRPTQPAAEVSQTLWVVVLPPNVPMWGTASDTEQEAIDAYLACHTSGWKWEPLAKKYGYRCGQFTVSELDKRERGS